MTFNHVNLKGELHDAHLPNPKSYSSHTYHVILQIKFMGDVIGPFFTKFIAMKYSKLEIPSPTREQQLLIKLDELNPVDADEYQVSSALNRWLDQYDENDDDTTLDDMYYSEYTPRFSEDIGPVELLLCAPQWWSLLVSRAMLKGLALSMSFQRN